MLDLVGVLGFGIFLLKYGMFTQPLMPQMIYAWDTYNPISEWVASGAASDNINRMENIWGGNNFVAWWLSCGRFGKRNKVPSVGKLYIHTYIHTYAYTFVEGERVSVTGYINQSQLLFLPYAVQSHPRSLHSEILLVCRHSHEQEAIAVSKSARRGQKEAKLRPDVWNYYSDSNFLLSGLVSMVNLV